LVAAKPARLKEDPELKAIPVVAVTAFAMKGDEERIGEGAASLMNSGREAVPIRLRRAMGEHTLRLAMPCARWPSVPRGTFGLLQTICLLAVVSHHSRQEALDGIGEKRIPYPRPSAGSGQHLASVLPEAGKTRTLMPVWDSSGESRFTILLDFEPVSPERPYDHTKD
jgi:hypothetical protein